MANTTDAKLGARYLIVTATVVSCSVSRVQPRYICDVIAIYLEPGGRNTAASRSTKRRYGGPGTRERAPKAPCC
jgi:hypothetical protein